MESYIQLENIVKTYEKGTILAVDKVSFDVRKGEIFGLIGADGAGKTSIFRIIATLLLPDEGFGKVLGHDIIQNIRQIRNQIGYMPGRFSLYQDLSIEENLHFYASIFGTTIEENFHLIRDIFVQIEPFKKRRAGDLSGGMKQKLALCCALIHKPRVLLLDEPTTGIDPVSRKELWEMLRKLTSEDIAILVSTPYMDEALQCDRIGLMKNGKLMTINTPKALIQEYDKVLYEIYSSSVFQMLNTLRNCDVCLNSYAFGDTIHAVFKNDEEENLKGFLRNSSIQDFQIKKIKPTIEDCFIDLSIVKKD